MRHARRQVGRAARAGLRQPVLLLRHLRLHHHTEQLRRRRQAGLQSPIDRRRQVRVGVAVQPPPIRLQRPELERAAQVLRHDGAPYLVHEGGERRGVPRQRALAVRQGLKPIPRPHSSTSTSRPATSP